MVESPPKLGRIPISLRVPEDIVKELPYIAVFNRKTSTLELVREWIVTEASENINMARYQKFKQQITKIPKA